MARHETSAMTYLLVWLALVVLAAATYGLSRLALGGWNLPIALAIAVVKGLMVVLVFMHLLEHRGATRFFFVAALLFVVLLVALSTTDVVTRDQELPGIG